jgi:PAS domain S-box-containing protein
MVVAMAAVTLLALALYRQVGIRAAAERRLSENLYRVFDAKPDAILITDVSRQILWKNIATAKLMGENGKPDLCSLDWHFPGLQRMARNGGTHPLDRGKQSDEFSTFRDIVRRADGETVAVEVTQIPLMAESGENTTALFIRDISESQRAMRALRRERRLAEAEARRYQRFLAVMSHEIRSPLHAIMAALDLARQRPEASALADLLDIAIDAARIAVREADAVLEIGRAEHEMQATEQGVFSPSEILGDLVEMNGPTAHYASTKLAVEIGPDAEGAIVGLRACFWHAVANLLGNAVKFTRDGTITLRLSRTDGELRVEVEDTGPGIPPELQKVIFHDHYTRDPVTGGSGKGAGLGLGVFVEAVRAMSGQYGVECIMGKGSTFWFTFPAPSAGQPQSAEAPEPPNAVELPVDLSVLVVDDSHVNRTLIQKMFATLHLEANLAASGIDAVKLAQAFRYDLILMDLSMPDMDGYAAAAEIRQAGASQKATIVALTANVLARKEVDKTGSDFDGFLLKPLRLEELRSWLAESLHHPSVSQKDMVPVIDRGIARDLLDMLPQSAIEPLLEALFDETQDIAGELDLGISDTDLSVKFHKVAGSAGMLGAWRLRALALDGELTCRDKGKVPTPAFRAAWMRAIADTSRVWAALLETKSNATAATPER